MLGVAGATLAAEGAVSEAVALEMARGAVAHSHAEVAVAVSGIAGPGGGTVAKPVGTVCFGYLLPGCSEAETCLFEGDRERIRRASVAQALRGLIARCDGG
jgi:nicotinamide-nucleotide amidase